MKKKVSIEAEVDVATLNIAVNAIPNSAGDPVAYAGASSKVILSNISAACGVQYRVNQEQWAHLGRDDGIDLPINLLVDRLSLRRATYDGGRAQALLTIEGMQTANDSFRLKLSKRPKSNVITECISGFLAVPTAVGANPYSVMQQGVAPADWDTVEIGILNASASAVVGMKVLFGAGTTLGPANGPLGLVAGKPIGGLDFTAATWIGAYAGGTLPASAQAATDANGANYGGSECGIGWTEPIANPSLQRADGTSGLPVYQVILTYPAGAERSFVPLDGTTSVGWENEGSDTVAPFNRPVRIMVAATKDAVANPAWMMASNGGCVRSYTELPPILLRFTLRNGTGETLVLYTDSLGDGAGAKPQKCGWPREFQARASTKQNPVAICNLSVSGSGMASWAKRIKITYPSFSQVSVYSASLTPNNLPNGPITDATIQLARRDFAVVRKLLEKQGCLFFTSTIVASDYSVKAYGQTDVKRVAWNDEKRMGNWLLADFDKALSGPVDANGQATLPESDDKIHPNQIGYFKMGVGVFLPLWQSV